MSERRVKVRMIVEYDVGVPADWTPHDIEFHRNDSSWCCSNALDELEIFAQANDCLCNATRFEYVGEVEPPADTGESDGA